MASVNRRQLYEAAVTANVNSDSQSLEHLENNFIGYLRVTDYVAGTFTVLIQDSPDGVNWFTLVTFVAASANGAQAVAASRAAMVNVRANIVTAAGPDATIHVSLLNDKVR